MRGPRNGCTIVCKNFSGNAEFKNFRRSLNKILVTALFGSYNSRRGTALRPNRQTSISRAPMALHGLSQSLLQFPCDVREIRWRTIGRYGKSPAMETYFKVVTGVLLSFSLDAVSSVIDLYGFCSQLAAPILSFCFVFLDNTS